MKNLSACLSPGGGSGWIGEPKDLGEGIAGIEVQSTETYGIQGSLEVWVSGAIRDWDGTGPAELRVLNEHGNMRYLRPVYSADGEQWSHVEDFGQIDDGDRLVFSFSVPPSTGTGTTHFATWWPYTFSRHSQLLAELQALPFVSVEELGRSVNGRPLSLVTVSDGPPQPVAFISGGMHGAETSGMYGVEGALRYVCSDAGKWLRERARWVFLPLVNPDAQAEGLDRRNAAGVNLWVAPDARDQPEIRTLLSAMRDARPSVYLDLHSWHWGSDGCYVPAWTSTGDELYDRVLRLRRTIEAQFPMGSQIFMSDDPTCWLVEVSRTLGVPAISPEISLSRGTDGVWKTRDRARQDGASILRGASAFLGHV